MKSINQKSVANPLSNTEMRNVTGGGDQLLYCWCCGSDEFFIAKSLDEASEKCSAYDHCAGCGVA